MTRVRRVHHTGVSVADMERSLAFYRDLLGLEVTFDSDVRNHEGFEAVVAMEEARGRVVWLGAGDETILELWQYENPKGRPLPTDYRPADHGVTHYALEVEDVHEVHRRIVEAGHAANASPQDLDLHLTTYVRGPDGEIIEILEDRATEGRLRELTEASQRRRAARGVG
ncbi:MAG: VOC family protein [Acidobacteriota bacterium]